MGSVQFLRQRGIYYVQWGKHKVYRYNGRMMRKALDHKGNDLGLADANSLLSVMRGDYERGVFRIERFTKEAPTDVIPWLKKYLETACGHLSAGTIYGYNCIINNHLIPWFQKNPVQLHEIQYDTLCELLDSLQGVNGDSKYKIIYVLRGALVYAKKANRINVLPLLPEGRKYGKVKKDVMWLSGVEQAKIIDAIPAYHRPIFLWIKYHFRRIGEACNMKREDYVKELDAFWVSDAKTHARHLYPCHPAYKPTLNKLPVRLDSPYLFINPRGHKKHKGQYKIQSLEKIWARARKAAGIDITMYKGLKHSSCSQYINEQGGTVDECQMLTGHKRRDTVLKYADVTLDRRRELMVCRIDVGPVSENKTK